MEKSLNDLLNEHPEFTDAELWLFARGAVRNSLNQLTTNQLGRVYKLAQEIARENEVAR